MGVGVPRRQTRDGSIRSSSSVFLHSNRGAQQWAGDCHELGQNAFSISYPAESKQRLADCYGRRSIVPVKTRDRRPGNGDELKAGYRPSPLTSPVAVDKHLSYEPGATERLSSSK